MGKKRREGKSILLVAINYAFDRHYECLQMVVE